MFTVRSTKAPRSSARKNSLPPSSKHRAGKTNSFKSRRSFKDQSTLAEKAKHLNINEQSSVSASTDSSIVTIAVGRDNRLFACHESVLSMSPFFSSICHDQPRESTARRINIPDELPEVFSSILEFLYKGDYHPKLIHDQKRNSWTLEDTQNQKIGSSSPAVTTIYDHRIDQVILKDTVLYCSADRYGLEDLKKLALRKQGLQSRVQCSIILASARFAYDNTPESDAKLRAHYLALIIRSRQTFKRSGTLQSQMELGGKMFFDLFVAMCNHMDDISTIARSPR